MVYLFDRCGDAHMFVRFEVEKEPACQFFLQGKKMRIENCRCFREPTSAPPARASRKVCHFCQRFHRFTMCIKGNKTLLYDAQRSLFGMDFYSERVTQVFCF